MQLPICQPAPAEAPNRAANVSAFWLRSSGLAGLAWTGYPVTGTPCSLLQERRRDRRKTPGQCRPRPPTATLGASLWWVARALWGFWVLKVR
jgi:hypothetical protein